MAAVAGFSRKAKGLLRRGWNEIPEVIASTGLAFIGLAMGVPALYLYYKNDGDHRKYKNEYTVYRPDDPRVKYIKK